MTPHHSPKGSNMKNRLAGAWRWLTAPKRRQWEYRVALAGVALASTYGLVQGEKLAALGFLVSALFGQAQANVDTGEGDEPDDGIGDELG